ncbi:MAG: M56 family metallopeptidase [Gemmatimonadota bacterium]
MTIDGNVVLAFLLNITLKITVILGLAGMLAFALRRSAASLRHLVWTLALGAALATPALTLALPGLSVPGLDRLLPRLESSTDVEIEREPKPVQREEPPGNQVAEHFASADRGEAATVPVTAQATNQTVSAANAAAPTSEPARPQDGYGVRGVGDDHRKTSLSVADQPAYSAPVSTHRLPWTLGLALIWLSGAALVLASVLTGIARTRRIARSSRILREGRLARAVADASSTLGLARKVTLLLNTAAVVPMTWGALRPKVLLPQEAEAWPEDRLRAVLLHELAHVRRHDYLTQLVARLACALYWFNPVVWIAASQLRRERELACDDQVLRAGPRASEYAGYLLDVARGLKSRSLRPTASVAMARSSKLGDRLRAVLDSSRERRALKRWQVLPAWLGATLLVLPIAAATSGSGASRVDDPAAQAGSSFAFTFVDSNGAGLEVGTAAVGLELASGPAVSAAALADRVDGFQYDFVVYEPYTGDATLRLIEVPLRSVAFGRAGICDWAARGSSHNSTSIEIDDDHRVEARVRRDDCQLDIDISGDVEFNDSETDVVRVSSRGRFEIEEKEGRESRRIRIDAGRNGELERKWYVNGKEQPYDDEARRWLAEMLPTMFRVTGIQAKERALRIVSTQGVDGLLQEISFITSDHTASKYYGVLLTQPDLDAATYKRVVRQAGEEISSDHSLAMLLLTIAESDALDESAVQLAYVESAGSISSDHEQGRVLKAILSRPNLSQQAADEMLQRATEISSDHELAKLLITFVQTHPLDQALTPAFFAAVRTISSDHEQARVLKAVLAEGAPNQQVLDLVLGTATSISSDHVLGGLLKEVAASYPIDQAIPASYMTAAKSIDSDHELAAVLSALIQRGSLSTSAQVSLLDAAQTISSDHETGRFLIQFAEAYGISDATRAPFFRAVGTISSDHTHGQVLTSVIELPDLTEADLAAVLGSAMMISSDHSVTMLLVSVADSYALEGDVREAYLRVAESVSSDIERNRALAAIVRR